MSKNLNYKIATALYHKVTDGTHDSPKKKTKGFPLITSKHIKGSTIDFQNAYLISKEDYNKINERSQVEQWDVIISMIGEYCGYCFIEQNKVINYAVKNVGLFKTGNKFEAQWLYYYLTSPIGKQQLNLIKSGSSQPYLTLGGLRKLPILIKESDTERRKIAKVLSDLDAKIELNNKINAELEDMAKLIYDYWFVQFNYPDKNGKPYKSSGGKMVFNDELKRDIPEGWEVNTLSTWIKNDKSGDWGKESKEGNYTEKVSCIRGADINGLNGKGEVKSPTRFILEKNSHKMLEVGDFIIEISGGSPTQSTGRMALIIKESLDRFDNPLICSNFCKAVTLKNESAIFNFSFMWQRLYDAGVLFGWEGKTSGIKNFLFESFVTKHKAPIPPMELMKSFYDKVYPIHAKIQKNLKQNQQLSSLRDWLLPMLMNGQVTVKTAYDKMEEVELGVAAEGEGEYK